MTSPITKIERLPINQVAKWLLSITYDRNMPFPMEREFLIHMCNGSAAMRFNSTHKLSDVNFFRYEKGNSSGPGVVEQFFCPVNYFLGQKPQSVMLGPVDQNVNFEAKKSGFDYIELDLILDFSSCGADRDKYVSDHAATLIIDHDNRSIKFMDPYVGKTQKHNVFYVKHSCRALISMGYSYEDTSAMPPSFQSLYDTHDYVGMGCNVWAVLLGVYAARNREKTLHELLEPFYEKEVGALLHLFTYWYKRIAMMKQGRWIKVKNNPQQLTPVFDSCQEMCVNLMAVALSPILDKIIPSSGRFLHNMCAQLSELLDRMKSKLFGDFAINWSEITFVWTATHQLNLMMLLWENDFEKATPSVNSEESKLIYFLQAMYKLFDGYFRSSVPKIPQNIRQLFVHYYVNPWRTEDSFSDFQQIMQLTDQLESDEQQQNFTMFIHTMDKLSQLNAKHVCVESEWTNIFDKKEPNLDDTEESVNNGRVDFKIDLGWSKRGVK